MSRSYSVPTLMVALLPAATIRWYNHVSCVRETTRKHTARHVFNRILPLGTFSCLLPMSRYVGLWSLGFTTSVQ